MTIKEKLKHPHIVTTIKESVLVNLIKDHLKKKIQLDVDLFIDFDVDYNTFNSAKRRYSIGLNDNSDETLDVLEENNYHFYNQSNFTNQIFEEIFGEGVLYDQYMDDLSKIINDEIEDIYVPIRMSIGCFNKQK